MADDKVLCGERVIPIPTRNTRKIAQRGKGNGSSAQKKGWNCKTTPLKKYILTHPKAHHHPQYEELFKRFVAQAGG